MGRFPGSYKAAISYTFDDGTADHYHKAFPLLAQRGLRGTFFVIPGLIKDEETDVELRSQLDNGPGRPRRLASWRELGAMAHLGQEIGNHSLTHQLLWRQRDSAEVQRDILESYELLFAEIGVEPRSWAWPYYRPHLAGEKTVRRLHAYSRSRKPQLSFGKNMTLDRANAWLDKAVHYKEWFIVVIHQIGNAPGAVAEEVVEKHLDYAESKRSEIWIAPTGEIARYLGSRFSTCE